MGPKENSKKVRKETFDIYVGHLPKVINQDKLRNVFSKYGEISDVFCRHSNSPLGYAIVKFKNKEDVDRLLKEVDKVHVNGYEMEVKIGVKTNQGTQNGDGAHSKTVSFSEPVSYIPPQMNSVHMIDTNLHVRDNKFIMPFAQSEMNENLMQGVEIICTNVENSVTFHGCYICRYEELQNVSLNLNSICPNFVRLNRKPLMKKVYAAMYRDGRWYRCVVYHAVISNRPGACIVEYIDYGNFDEVYYTNMVDLPEPLQNVCPFALKCIFSNLTCNPNYHIDDSYLHTLLNKRMTLSAVAFKSSTWGVPEYQVYKCSSDGIDVVNELVRNGHAVYRAQLSSKSSPPLHKPENPGCSKSLENPKPKKGSTNKTHPKKVTIKEMCNGVEKSEGKSVGGEGMNIAVNDAVKSPKNCSSDDFQHTENLIPKRIMKRGSDISDVAPAQVLEGSKSVNHSLEVDGVLSNLNFVNNLRNLVFFPADNSLIDNAVDILRNEVTLTVSQDQKSLLESAHKKYNEALNNIKECNDKELLYDLKEKRNSCKTEFHNVLKQFVDSFDCSLIAKRKELQELITDLGSNSTEWMNVHISCLPDTIEDLVAEYKKERELQWSIIKKARENTNEKHKKFMEFFGDFEKEFSLNMLDGSVNSSCHLENSGGKKGFCILKFKESMRDFEAALEEEMKTCSVTKGKGYVPIINCILEKLDTPKERIDNECELYMKYKSLYDDLNNTSDLSPLFEELSAVQKNIKALTLDCVDDEEKLQNRLAELHSDLLLEDMLLVRLAKVSAVHFPELILENPELNLLEYKNNLYLLKINWHKLYFPVLQNCIRVEPSYISKIAEDLVVIKEFNVGCELEKKALIKKALIWNEIKSKSLVKIKALFNKDKGVCVMLPQVWKTLYENPLPVPVDYKMACSILQQVLKGLFDIHERGMAHGAVHPSAVLHKDGNVLLDFNYDKKFVQDTISLKGINFQDPSGESIYKSTDMYAFGCLVLWILFPNLSFTSADNGVPNILSFQSIIQDLLSSNDFTDLSNLLKPNHYLRPTSKDLYKKGFLKDLRIITK